jgi:cytochrome c oxidase subunit III
MTGRSPSVSEQFDDASQQREASTLGMWAFLATEILFFGVLIAAYTLCRVRYPEAFAAGSRRTDVVLGTIETAVLLASSCTVALAVRDIQLGGRRIATWLLSGTAALGVAFLCIHGFEYTSEYHEGLIPALHYVQDGPQAVPMQMFFFLYYVTTLFHGLHVTIGVVLLLVMARRTHRGDFRPRYHTPVELSALYWHLVDIVWIFVFPLMYLIGRA